jgi:hypothetical protein
MCWCCCCESFNVVISRRQLIAFRKPLLQKQISFTLLEASDFPNDIMPGDSQTQESLVMKAIFRKLSCCRCLLSYHYSIGCHLLWIGQQISMAGQQVIVLPDFLPISMPKIGLLLEVPHHFWQIWLKGKAMWIVLGRFMSSVSYCGHGKKIKRLVLVCPAVRAFWWKLGSVMMRKPESVTLPTEKWEPIEKGYLGGTGTGVWRHLVTSGHQSS